VRLTPDYAFFPRVADPARVSLGRERWRDAASAQADPDLARWMTDIADDGAAAPLLDGVFANSPFLTSCLEREPGIARALLAEGPDAPFARLLDGLEADLGREGDTARLKRGLRVGKRRAALLIALADLAGAWDLGQVTGALSTLAERAIRLSLDHLLRREAERGAIRLADPDRPWADSGFLVLGMGKLGAGELNYSSDIDLIVLYDPEKIAYVGRRSVQECMVALTRDLARCLDERTADGYVFRTDLRLRPDPGSTPPAVSLPAAETYYESFGQNWERAAMIKARPVAGDPETGAGFIRFLRPFLWRRSLDFAAIEDIHSIKRQINAHRGGRTIAVAGHNIKLGRGGIREIEFFAQTQQLIWGGRIPALRLSGTRAALDALAALGHVTPEVAEALNHAYVYLRTLEHRLQMIEDSQTQTLPADPAGLAQVAAFMGHAESGDFARVLTGHLQAVETHYARLFEDAPALARGGNLVFTGGETDPETLTTLAGMGFRSPETVAETVRGWHHGRVRATRSTRARELLTELIPTLLGALAGTAAPDEAFLRFDTFLGRLPAGVPLFSLFYANPSLLDLVAEIMGDAPALAEHLGRHPVLLDSVLASGFFAPPPPQAELAADLEATLQRGEDFQQTLDLARRWANDRKFQVGVLTLRALIPPDQAAAALSDVAQAVISGLGRRVEAEFARTHGRVPGGAWVILALGKAGGREMSATSDLDLILVYDAPPEAEESNGPRPIATATWFARLTQRMVNALSAKTGEGTLYEVDMRLRPSGHSGPIAASLESFRRYQAEAAWTWEHMALTRARVVAGDPALAARVDAVIGETLGRQRAAGPLLADIADMRERIEREHKTASPWDVKYRRGGLIDIEFAAQALQLRHAHDHPDLPHPTTALVLARAQTLGLIGPDESAALAEALSLWSAVQFVLRLTVAPGIDPAHAPRGLRDLLVRVTGLGTFSALVARMDECAARAHAVYQRLVEGPAHDAPSPSSPLSPPRQETDA